MTSPAGAIDACAVQPRRVFRLTKQSSWTDAQIRRQLVAPGGTRTTDQRQAALAVAKSLPPDRQTDRQTPQSRRRCDGWGRASCGECDAAGN